MGLHHHRVGNVADSRDAGQLGRHLRVVDLDIVGHVSLGERDVPDYIDADHSKMSAKMSRIPGLGEVPYPVQMEPHLVVEYYSR